MKQPSCPEEHGSRLFLGGKSYTIMNRQTKVWCERWGEVVMLQAKRRVLAKTQ